MAAAAVEHIALAQSLPPRLLHFFKRFPPPQLSASQQAKRPETIRIAENTSSTDPNAAASTLEVPIEPPTPTSSIPWKTNPFLPSKNPTTGSWHSPHYSLRRQSDLYKLAQTHHVLPLMPLSPKHPHVKEARRIEHGLRVKGTGAGQRVKGKYWERTLQSRLETRRKAIESMPDMINLWKERGHGRGWKRFPKGKARMGGEGEVFKSDMRHAWVHERAGPSV